METRIFHPEHDTNAVAEAAAILRRGGLLGIPTETVYGLGADALNEDAVRRIFEAKGRPQDNPLIIHVPSVDWLERYCQNVPAAAYRLAEKFWPGPLTMILPRREIVPLRTTGGLETVGVRCPNHPATLAIIEAAGVPIAAPSGNTSGRPSPTTAQHMMDDMAGKIDGIVDGGPCAVGVESTVVDLSGETPRLLRPGGVTLEMLEAVAGPVDVDEAVTHALREGAAAASPGMKYKHYAPAAHVVLVKGSPAAYAAYVNRRGAAFPGRVTAMCFDGEESALTVPFVTYGRREDGTDQAHRLFDALRRLDELGAEEVYAACPPEDGVGLAVYNRMLRASGFEVVDADEPAG